MAVQVTEHHLAVRKTARFCLLGDLGKDTSELWIVCHGFGQLAREFLPAFMSIASPRRAVVAPEALSRFYRSQGTVHTPDTPVGATWMTSEDRESEIADYVAYLDTLLAEIRPRVSPDARVTVLGFSQGSATVGRWIARSAPAIDRFVLWGGLLPPEFAPNSHLGGLTRQPATFVCGSNDRYLGPPQVELELKRLRALGLTVTFVEFAGGHQIDSATLGLLAEGK